MVCSEDFKNQNAKETIMSKKQNKTHNLNIYCRMKNAENNSVACFYC